MKKKMLRERPIAVVWNGHNFIPLPRFKKMCDEQFAVDEEVILERVQNRSLASHNHYFACLHEGYQNLAEEYAQEFDSIEHMRHWCLCREGFCTTTKIAMSTREDASQLRQTLKGLDASTIIGVSENIATIYHPASQSMKAMGKEAFEESKQKVLARVASMARTTVAELKKNAGKAA
jgi:BMFP domain-containing protein YqiC